MVGPLLPLRIRDAEVIRAGKRLIGPIDLDIDANGILVIIGPNGAGKTTLLRMMHGLEPIHSGALAWSAGGQDVRTRQSFVFQTPIILRRTVCNNLAFPLILRGLARPTARSRAVAFAERFQLDQILDQPAARISGGEQQKLALARALISEPEILFLDEPCANLDGRATRTIETLLAETRANGTKIVLSTHDLGQARRLADHVLFLLDGHIHEAADAASFFAGPTTPEAVRFLAGDIVT